MDDTKKIVVHLSTGYCGMDAHEFYEINADATEDDITEFCWELALDNAAAYGIYPAEEIMQDDDIDFSYNISGYYEDYNPEEHDKFIVGNTNTPVFNKITL